MPQQDMLRKSATAPIDQPVDHVAQRAADQQPGRDLHPAALPRSRRTQISTQTEIASATRDQHPAHQLGIVGEAGRS